MVQWNTGTGLFGVSCTNLSGSNPSAGVFYKKIDIIRNEGFHPLLSSLKEQNANF